VVADRAGHAMHTAIVSRLLRDHSLWEETTDESGGVTAYSGETVVSDSAV
jgi:UDP-3-O-[3-hydroxymyristoyl] N-acetylglucosamine deacetylase